MGGVVLTSSLVTESVGAYWSEMIEGWLPTIYPGRQIDSSDWQEWSEYSVSTWKGPIQRSGGWERLRVQLTSQVFVRKGTNLGRGAEIAERIRGLTAQICLPVKDRNDEEAAIVGYLRLYEPEVKNLSLHESNPGESGLEHWTMDWRGIAEATGQN